MLRLKVGIVIQEEKKNKMKIKKVKKEGQKDVPKVGTLPELKDDQNRVHFKNAESNMTEIKGHLKSLRRRGESK